MTDAKPTPYEACLYVSITENERTTKRERQRVNERERERERGGGYMYEEIACFYQGRQIMFSKFHSISRQSFVKLKI